MAGDVRVPHHPRVRRRLPTRLDAVEEVAGVCRDVQSRPRLGELFQLGPQRGRVHLDLAAVADLHPPLVADEPHRAGAEVLDPAGALVEGGLEEVEHQLHAVGVTRGDVGRGGLVLDGHGVVGLVGPLAEVNGVRAPVEQPRAGVEVVIAAPGAPDVGLIVRPPRGGAQPEVPVDHVLLGRRLARQPGGLDLGRIDRGVKGVELAELAAVGQPDGRLEVRHAAPLGAGLEDAAGALHGVGQAPAGGDGQAARLFTVDVLAGLRREDRRRGVPAVAGRDEDGVDVLAREHIAQVAEEGAIRVAVVPVDQGLAGLPAAGLDVADGDTLHVGEGEHALEVVGAAWADPDDAERDLLAGRHGAPATHGPSGDDRRKRERRARREGMLQQVPSRRALPFIPIRLHGKSLLKVPAYRSPLDDKPADAGVQDPAVSVSLSRIREDRDLSPRDQRAPVRWAAAGISRITRRRPAGPGRPRGSRRACRPGRRFATLIGDRFARVGR